MSEICCLLKSWEMINQPQTQPTKVINRAGTSQLVLLPGLVFTSSNTSAGAANTLKMRDPTDVVAMGVVVSGTSTVGGWSIRRLLVVTGQPPSPRRPGQSWSELASCSAAYTRGPAVV